MEIDKKNGEELTLYPLLPYQPQKLMSNDKFTTAAAKAITAAISLAEEQSHVEVAPAHLAYALFTQDKSVAVRVAERCNIVPKTLVDAFHALVGKVPKQTPAPKNVQFTNSLRNVRFFCFFLFLECFVVVLMMTSRSSAHFCVLHPIPLALRSCARPPSTWRRTRKNTRRWTT